MSKGEQFMNSLGKVFPPKQERLNKIFLLGL
jgi:hypothetical protein